MTDLKSLLHDTEPEAEPIDVDAIVGRGDRLRRQRQRRTAVASAAAAVVLVAGMVGVVNRSSSTPERPVELLAGAGDAVRDEGSARVHMVMEVTSDEHAARTDLAGTVDFVNDRGRLSGTANGESLVIIGDGPLVYVSVPESSRTRTNGKPWASYPKSDPSNSLLDLGNPAAILEQLRQTADVEEVGADEVNGLDTTH